ncbi:MAG: S-layer family protein, partial [Planctomycetota bacterium]
MLASPAYSAGTATSATRGEYCASSINLGLSSYCTDYDFNTSYNPSPYAAHDSVDLPKPVPYGSGTLIDPLSTSSLFSPVPTGHYLLETDPRFANYRTWLSSDTMLSALGIDPAATQKRMGDGFYEQQLLREQVGQLTGRRFLEGYANDEAQFQALMNSGVTYAQAHQLRPGVSLSAEQMAQLTSDIVWLVEKTVTLKDGSTAKVLAPQLYVRVQEGDLATSGALISGDSVHLNVSGDLTNSGTIAGRSIVNLNAENVHNLGGRISGTNVDVQARNDLNNLGGSLTASSSLAATAGRDLKVISTTNTQSSAQSSSTQIGRVAGLYVTGAGGTLIATAGRDLQLDAAAILNSAPTGATAGSTTLAAGRDLNLGVVTESTSHHLVWDAANQRSDASRTDIGTTIQTQGDIRLQAGGDLNAKAANVSSAQGAVLATAGGSVHLTAGQASVQVDEDRKHTSRVDWLTKKTTSSHDTLDQTNALGSTLSGNTTTVLANQDIQVQGSNIVSTQGTLLAAQNNVTIEAAKNSTTESHLKDQRTSGLFSGGGIAITVGSQQQAVNQNGTT